jgi:hypothetical protein
MEAQETLSVVRDGVYGLHCGYSGSASGPGLPIELDVARSDFEVKNAYAGVCEVA